MGVGVCCVYVCVGGVCRSIVRQRLLDQLMDFQQESFVCGCGCVCRSIVCQRLLD